MLLMELSVLTATACDSQSVRTLVHLHRRCRRDQRTRLMWRGGRVLAQQRHPPLVRRNSAVTSPITSLARGHHWGLGRRQRVRRSEVLVHDTVVFAAGTQTESVKMQTQELFGTGEITTVTLVSGRSEAATMVA
jgi:hypothetical protein